MLNESRRNIRHSSSSRLGYFNATVTVSQHSTDGKQLQVVYEIHPGYWHMGLPFGAGSAVICRAGLGLLLEGHCMGRNPYAWHRSRL